MDARRERELRERLPFELDPQTTIADRLPIEAERVIGFTIVIATFLLLFGWPFLILFLVLSGNPLNEQMRVVAPILARTLVIVYSICFAWNLLWFTIYVALGLKDRTSLPGVPGAPDELEEIAQPASGQAQSPPRPR